MKLIWRFIIARLREPASWAGLAILVTQAGYGQELADALVNWMVASVALVAIVLPNPKA